MIHVLYPAERCRQGAPVTDIDFDDVAAISALQRTWCSGLAHVRTYVDTSTHMDTCIEKRPDDVTPDKPRSSGNEGDMLHLLNTC